MVLLVPVYPPLSFEAMQILSFIMLVFSQSALQSAQGKSPVKELTK